MCKGKKSFTLAHFLLRGQFHMRSAALAGRMRFIAAGVTVVQQFCMVCRQSFYGA